MIIDENKEKNIYIISVKGKLINPVEVEELSSHFRYLRDNGIRKVVLDLKKLDWMGSIGLGALVSCITTMRNAGGDVRMANLNKKLQTLLNITKLDQIFSVYKSVELAINSFSAVKH